MRNNLDRFLVANPWRITYTRKGKKSYTYHPSKLHAENAAKTKGVKYKIEKMDIT